MRHPPASRASSPRRHAAFSFLPAASLALVAVVTLDARPSFAQQSGSLERFTPAPAGDAMFGVPSPAIGGHLVPRAAVIFDFAYRPLSVQQGSVRSVIVSHQLYLHLDASLALWDRLLVSADMPFALAQGGDSPSAATVTFQSPSGAQVGDLRLGARVRLFGGFWDPFQIGLGSYLYVPTAPAASYAGEGGVRGEPHVVVGGRFQHFVYSASLGTTIKASDRPHTFDARVGAAAVLGQELVQVGPELSLAVPLSENVLVTSNAARISAASPIGAELLFGVKVRPLRFLVLGAGAGPGLSQGWGTPVFSAVASVGYEPLPPRPGKQAADVDDDGIPDATDACPKVPGVSSEDPKKHGCPPDTDADGIVDEVDACPKVPGVATGDPKTNGCPADRDGDGVLDAVDACPDVAGKHHEDPKTNGCPPDADGDGIFDAVDACPKEPGVKSENPKKNGCPPDTDGDGILDAVDACPEVRGGPDKDPKKHGCPHVTVTKTEIVISHQVQFHFGKSSLDQTVDPVSEDLLTEVRDAIVLHPDIEQIEVQGHADNVGDEAYNQKLSTARAQAVRNWLIKNGIAPSKLVAKGYGSKAPRAVNVSDEGRKENRRVQFKILEAKEKP